MSDDPHPETRCRCTARFQITDIWSWERMLPNPYYDRCEGQITTSDGYCSHCGTPHDPGTFQFQDGTFCSSTCCSSKDYFRQPVFNLKTPCFDRETNR